MKRFGDYTKLHGSTLWAGPDHLLYIQDGRVPLSFSETYKRLDYKNIQSVTVHETSRFKWILFLLLITFGAVLWVWLANVTPEWSDWTTWAFPGGGAALLFVLLVMHLFKGESAELRVQTAVQSLRIPSVKRAKQAHLVVQKLTELCERHQGGGIQPAMLAAAVSAAPAALPFAKVAMQRPSLKPAFPGARRVTLALVLLLLTGAAMMAEPFVPHVALLVGEIVLGVLTLIGLVVAVAKVMRFNSHFSIHLACWSGSALLLLTGFSIYITLIFQSSFAATRNRNRVAFSEYENMWGQIRKAAETSPDSGAQVLWYWFALGAVFFLLALFALPAALRPLGRAETQSAVPPPLPPPPAPSAEV